MNPQQNLRRAFVAALCAAALPGAWAQAYPEHPVRVLHGFAAGGNADAVARLVATELQKQLGQPFVVEPKPGAGGTLAADAVAKAKPDGYTLLVATGGHAIAAVLYDKLPYDTLKAFQPVSALTTFPFLVTVNAGSRYNTLQDVLAAARAKPATLNYGSAGIGTGQHLTGALLAHRAGVTMTHVPYRGDSGSVTALLGGEVDFVLAPPTAVIQHIRAGKLRALAVSGSSRLASLPNVPTVAEQGVPNYEVRSWTAVLAPAGTPKAVVDRLNAALRTALADDTLRQKLEEATGGDVRASTPDELQAVVESDVKRWQQLVRDASIRKE
ncbi:MAG: tripartite tricarboxylate transporter substrate binding protein [Burkholderiales bacterium]